MSTVLFICSCLPPSAWAQTHPSAAAALGTPQTATYHVDMQHAWCSDMPGSGSESFPFCTLAYVATIAKPGDLFLVHEGRYGHTPASFTKSGTATLPITYRAVGDVVIGGFLDLDDSQFQPTATANIYTITDPGGGKVFQTYFDDIRVDDPGNSSDFTMIDEDGPLALSAASSDAVLAQREGTYRRTGGRLLVHPYSNYAPSAADLVVGYGTNAYQVESNTKYNVFEGFRVAYTGLSLRVMGSNNTLRNVTFQAGPLQVRGSNNIIAGYTVSHVIERGETWQWHYSGTGTAVQVHGTGHQFTSGHVFHSWNAHVSTEGATNVVIDGLVTHGSPNHCGAFGATGGGANTTVRNWAAYNCQDYFLVNDNGPLTFEHMTVPGGILLRKMNAHPSPITVRNSIFGGSINYGVYTGAIDVCTHESGTLLEGNVMPSNALIHHCADKTDYPVLEYIAKCESGALTGCMTIRDNQYVSPNAWSSVIRDGMWIPSLGDAWDVSLVPDSPAINAGITAGAPTDIVRIGRPQGLAPDAGVYELPTSGYTGPTGPTLEHIGPTVEQTAPTFERKSGPPATPQKFAAHAVDNTAALQWTAAPLGPATTGYVLEVGSTPGATNLLTLPLGNVTSLNAVAATGTYYVRLRSVNAAGQSEPTRDVRLDMGCTVPPGVPVSLQAAIAGPNVTLNWLKGTGNVARYILEAGSGPGLRNQAIATIPAPSTTFSAVAPPGTYFIRVRAANACGTSDPSGEIFINVGATATLPGAAGTPTATVNGSAVSLAWAAPTTGDAPTRYMLEAGVAPGLSNVRVALGAAPSFATSGVLAGTYYVRVRAVNAAGTGPASADVIVVVQ